jgi:hypothetical protein
MAERTQKTSPQPAEKMLPRQYNCEFVQTSMPNEQYTTHNFKKQCAWLLMYTTQAQVCAKSKGASLWKR